MSRANVVYDHIASTVDHEASGIYRPVRKMGLEQLCNHVERIDNVLDLCVGTGKPLEALCAALPVGEMIGNDASPEMVRVARGRCGERLKTICGDALDLQADIAPDSQHLVLSQFLFDYCEPREMYRIAYSLLRPGGYISVATTTKDQYSDRFWHQVSRLGFIGRLYDIRKAIDSGETPESGPHNFELMTEAGFDVVEQAELVWPACFTSPAELWRFCFEEGWAAGAYGSLNFFQQKILRSLVSLLALPGVGFFPVGLDCRVTVALGQKPGG